jgi:hypothetical protein
MYNFILIVTAHKFNLSHYAVSNSIYDIYRHLSEEILLEYLKVLSLHSSAASVFSVLKSK